MINSKTCFFYKTAIIALAVIASQINLNSQTQSAILSPDSKLIKLFDGAFFTEGPSYAPDGSIYFSDVTFTDETNMDAGIIWRYDQAAGKAHVYRSPSGMANGTSFDSEGNLIVCEGADYGGRKITSTDIKTGKSKIIIGLFNGHPFNSPNDLVIDSRNRIYFTDPKYVGWESNEQPCFGVYKIDKDNVVYLLIRDIKMPNGIAINKEENKLYIGCNFEGDEEKNISPDNAVYVYDLDSAGNASSGKLFVKLADDDYPDGITMDNSGNIYAAIRNEEKPCIRVYNKDAEIIGTISLPEVPSNLTFGKREDKNILFITAGQSLYKIKLAAEGF